MKNTSLLIILLLITSCKDNIKTVKGDLSFKLVNFTSPNGMKIEQANKIEKMLDSLEFSNNADEKALIDYFGKLRKHKLLRVPYIKLRFSDNDIKTIFLSNEEHQKLKKYSLDYLTKNNSKLVVELKIKELDSLIYYSDEIISFNEVKGKTYFEK